MDQVRPSGVESARGYLPPMVAWIFFWIPSRLKEPGVWLGGYSFMVMRKFPATLCIGARMKTRSRNQSL